MYWSTELHKSFDQVISSLSSLLLLTYFDSSLEVVIALDASDHDISAVMNHKFSNGKERAIVPASRTFISVGRTYIQVEKEVLELSA